jgi:peptidoglycan/xylan/chitin deacetylase (PgdA/CDA1 family)
VTPRVTVIAYHAVGDCARAHDDHNLFVSAASFSTQMAFLARRRQVVSLDDAVAGHVAAGRPAVAITFDDGYRSVLRVAGPVLQERGFPAALFVPTAWIGKRNEWIAPTPCDVDLMTAAELRELESMGVRVQSHGHAHMDFAAATEAEAGRDLKEAADRLEAIVGRRPQYFAYPYGTHSPTARRAVENSGASAAFTIDSRHAGRFAYARVQITPTDGPALFAIKTSGRYLDVRNARPVAGAYSIVRPLVRRLLDRA